MNALVAVSSQELSTRVCDFLISKGIGCLKAAENMYGAIDHMRQNEFTLLIVEGQLKISGDSKPGEFAGLDFVKFTRMCTGGVSEAPVVFIRSEPHALDLIEANAEILDAKNAGVNSILTQPFTCEKFEKFAEPALMEPQTFVRSPYYTGPCRRMLDMFVDEERRVTGEYTEKTFQ